MVAEQPVEAQLLAQLLEVPVAEVTEICRDLAAEYEGDDRGFTLVAVAGGWRFQSHPDLAPYVERFVLEGQSARLSAAALETLAIVAYKQPVSRAQVAAIRGVNVDGVMRTLQVRGYIEEVGRDPGPGQAVLFGTTSLFLERLGIEGVDDLPGLSEFVPGADVVEHLELGLRPEPGPTLGEQLDELEAGSPTRAPVARRRSRSHARRGRPSDGVRIQKVLAQAGLGSRRTCEELIDARRVRVNGEVAILGRRVDPEVDVVEVDGVQIGVRAGLVHYLLNKPAGVITTASDPQGRPTVLDLVPTEPRVFPVGRLDADTEGLLLLTNDGDLTHRLTHPSFGVDKEYLVEVEGAPHRGSDPQAARGRRAGRRDDRAGQGGAARRRLLRITIHEGRNRQVRRMCEAVGHPVVRLVRTRIGPLADGA